MLKFIQDFPLFILLPPSLHPSFYWNHMRKECKHESQHFYLHHCWYNTSLPLKLQGNDVWEAVCTPSMTMFLPFLCVYIWEFIYLCVGVWLEGGSFVCVPLHTCSFACLISVLQGVVCMCSHVFLPSSSLRVNSSIPLRS